MTKIAVLLVALASLLFIIPIIVKSRENKLKKTKRERASL